MSGEALSSTVPASPAPQIEISNSEEMSPAERAYFDSRGQDTSGLVPSAPANDTPQPAKKEAELDGGDDDGEIEVEADATGRDPKTGRFVPKSAFLRVKGEAKQLKEQAATYRDNLIAARERLAILTEAAQPAQAQKDAQPDIADEPDIDPEVDIFGYAKQQAARAKRMSEQLKAMQNQNVEQQRRQAFQHSVSRYMQEAPDWKDAFSHLVAQRHAEMEMLGVADKAARDAQLREEAQGLINGALEKGQDPAKLLYEIAKRRGYQSKATQAADPLRKAQEELDRLESGKAASASLRGAGTSGVGEQLTLAQLANMGEDQYFATRDAYIAKNGVQAWERLKRG